MKIIDSRSVGMNPAPAQSSYAPASSKTSEVQSPAKDSGASSSLSPSALVMRANQGALAQTERAMGAISQLAETARKYPPSQVLTPLQNSILQVAASLQRAYPRYAQRLRNLSGNVEMLTSEINVIRKELNSSFGTQRRDIAKALITEQNKDAAAKRGYSSKDAATLASTLAPREAEALFSRRPQAAQLLQE